MDLTYSKSTTSPIISETETAETLQIAGTIAASAPPVAPDMVPTSSSENLGDILATGDGADVCFMVAGEPFLAHKCVLAARSSVLKEVLWAPWNERSETCIEVEDVDASVFRAMLHFVYTDSLPHIEEGNRADMAEGLLDVADTFKIERLKSMSEDMLRRGIDEETVASTLKLAEIYDCRELKKACLMFIKSTPLESLERGHAE